MVGHVSSEAKDHLGAYYRICEVLLAPKISDPEDPGATKYVLISLPMPTPPALSPPPATPESEVSFVLSAFRPRSPRRRVK